MSSPLARGTSPLRDLPLVGWLVAAVGVAIAHRWLPDAAWLLLHLVLLGAVSHAIMVWSFHFAQTLLRFPTAERDLRSQSIRLGLLAAGAATVLVGVPTTWWPVTVAGATLVAIAVAWHGRTLWRMLRRALPARFRVSVHYYLGAAAALLFGIGLGVTLAWGWDDRWHARLLVAHALANLLGWVGLTVAGTLLTLWPTMLRTRMDTRAELWTRRALPLFGAAITTCVAGALLGFTWLAALGLVGYLAAFALLGRGLWEPARVRPPHDFSTVSVAVSLLWLFVGLGWAGWLLVGATDWAAVKVGFGGPAAALAAGFGLQVLTGALSYLLPSVLGGGPAAVRAAQAWFNRLPGFRLVAINGGLLLWLSPTPSWVRVTGSVLALAAAAAFLPLMAGGLRASMRSRRAGGDDPPVEGGAEPAPVFGAAQLIAGCTAVATALVVGIGIDPAAAASGATPTASAPASGRVVRIEVAAAAMRFVPAQVHVRRGDRLVVRLTNTDTTTHDLVIGQAGSGRVAPGASVELDAGVVSGSVQGWCSVVGHRQMGMVFDVIVDDAAEPAAGDAPTASSTTGGHGHDPGAGEPPTDAPPASLVDPVLPALDPGRVHKLTLTAREVSLEVAPGVWQRRWTYNGTTPGPTLHGRVGDVFEITLVNDGSMGHSIDFHAGSLAPDRPMRTIEPGERLTYRFTATRAGVWLYHCSTMPMSAHIAAGMHGAVIIEPDGLAKADREFVLVQSEVYLQSRAADAASAAEVDADAVSAEQPDHVVFNGLANGYDRSPLTARAGERIRFWVVDAGPNRPSSFHIVGAQFDTVYREGGYLLREGRDGLGGTSGGAQVLGLQAAEGGFVETVFPEPGRYPLVSHSMVDAERGAHGYVRVTG
ncbi:MAG: multicopper oxidase domain-containing protein [Propionibacteriaceae bacterium]|nr:multicopper oxidase domain-containing protein [Propionibacteriaceae bacterium]